MFRKDLNIIIKCYRKLDSYQFSLLRIEHVLHFLKSQDGVFNAQKKRSFPAYGSSYWRLILEDWGFVHISFEQCIHGIHLVKKKAQNESHFTIRKLFKEVAFYSHCTCNLSAVISWKGLQNSRKLDFCTSNTVHYEFVEKYITV